MHDKTFYKAAVEYQLGPQASARSLRDIKSTISKKIIDSDYFRLNSQNDSMMPPDSRQIPLRSQTVIKNVEQLMPTLTIEEIENKSRSDNI